MKQPNIKDIDAILPQTQCGLCGYNGCMPYATALVENDAPINLCPPGGISGLLQLAKAFNKNPEPFMDDMQKKTKPSLRAIIREAECIGCTKCIKACPVDAILGSGKVMHTVIQDECTGCELCISPCPVDCIDMIPIDDNTHKKDQYRKRYQARQARLNKDSVAEQNHASLMVKQINKKDYIQAALERIKSKK